jgi:hypothetical protein
MNEGFVNKVAERDIIERYANVISGGCLCTTKNVIYTA